MTNLTIPPVLLIIFNRADLVARVFERIREQRPSQLFIAADGPRVSKPQNSSFVTMRVMPKYEYISECDDWYIKVR